eukprot:TRINITY_DN16137_c0_g1_i1.p1 TRINITY_DN16137_c0_g1~~TRINITY_DN16137_c0_g1_i1.p1  ORF type:complete len:100 (-),score=6.24 TRINITY_DN16137_c0_g1_i1:81-380(-)
MKTTLKNTQTFKRIGKKKKLTLKPHEFSNPIHEIQPKTPNTSISYRKEKNPLELSKLPTNRKRKKIMLRSIETRQTQIAESSLKPFSSRNQKEEEGRNE